MIKFRELNYDTWSYKVFLDLILPIIPVVFEFIANNNGISERSLNIFMSIYILCLGVQSETKIVLILSILVAMFLTFFYGLSYKKEESEIVIYTIKELKNLPIIIIIFICFFITFFIERLKILING